jgi:hypothetical protein
MGLYVHSLSRLPFGWEGMGRDYYIYVLDYGWHEPLGDALHSNFRLMAELAAKNKAAVIAGTDPRAFAEEIRSVHFEDPQFSWSSINGETGEDILPAIMIATIHPKRFLAESPGYRPRMAEKGIADDKLILIPLRGICKTSSEVTALIESIFRDVAAKEPLRNFEVAKKIKAGSKGAISDAIILKPTVWGMGVDLKALARAFTSKRAPKATRA